jgi:5'(3')-deoxyribonucleotidase
MSLLQDTLSRVKNIYVDMDGVVADFNGMPSAIDRFDNEAGFFANLTPLHNNLLAIEIIIGYGANVHILSASPNEQADKDKMEWLEKYLPDVPKENIIICRTGDTKADYVKDMSGALLIDDYTHNLIEWKENGGLALKFVGKEDNIVGKHTEHNIPYVNTLLELLG